MGLKESTQLSGRRFVHSVWTLPKGWMIILLGGILILSGCPSASQKDEKAPLTIDKPFEWTVGSQCELVNYRAVKVEGYSIVWGLQGTGSSECPPQVRDYLVQYLNRIEPWNHVEQYRGMGADQILMDKSTAVVQVNGIVPAGAPKGESFDVTVTALSATQTTSLQGGYLAQTDLRTVSPGFSGRMLASRPFAVADGPLFINPFVRADGTKSDPRRAMIFGGGNSIADRRIELALKTPDFRMAQMIQKAVNTRFPNEKAWKTADGTRDAITITIPEKYEKDYQRFISIVMALYLYDRPGDIDMVLNKIDERIAQGDADYEEVALSWEAVGRSALPYIEKHYVPLDTELAYFAARTALRLDDKAAIDTLIPVAMNDDHPAQLRAVADIGRYPRDPKARTALLQLLQKDSAMVRILAYDALRRVRDPEVRVVQTLRSFTIDLVKTDAEPFVCIWVAGDPRIVVFGDIQCPPNIFYESRNGLITINLPDGAQEISLIRQPSSEAPRTLITTSRDFFDVVRGLSFPLPKETYKGPTGLHLTFSEVAGILYDLNEQGVLKVPFHLQRVLDY